MKYRVLFLSLLSLVSSVAQAQSGSFCVQTFNVYAPAYASNVEYRVSRIAEDLLKEPCDSIQFQEIWKRTTYDQFSSEFAAANMKQIFADNLRHDQAMIGLSSAFHGTLGRQYSELYRVNNEDGFLDWFRNMAGVQKGLTAIETKLDNGPTVLYLNTHTHPTNETIRAAQMIQLLDFVIQRSPGAANLPIVLNGDFNATPDSLELRLVKNVLQLHDAYLETHGGNYGDTCTYCESNPLSWGGGNRVIDFVLFRASPTLELRAQQSALNLQGEEGSPLSDHYGVRSTLAFQDRTSGLLPADSALVLDRKALAIKTLEEAKQLLTDAENSVYEEAITKATGMIQALKTDRLPEGAALAFRLP